MRYSSYYNDPKNVRKALEVLRERHGLSKDATDEEIRQAELARLASTHKVSNSDMVRAFEEVAGKLKQYEDEIVARTK